MNTYETTLKNRAIQSAAWYLRRHDYQILNVDWSCKEGTVELVAKDGDCLVFVNVPEVLPREESFPEDVPATSTERKHWENIAMEWLLTSDYSDLPMRFDNVYIRRIDDDRCIIKHRVNALSQG